MGYYRKSWLSLGATDQVGFLVIVYVYDDDDISGKLYFQLENLSLGVLKYYLVLAKKKKNCKISQLQNFIV